jgi:uncharacterized membrane protein
LPSTFLCIIEPDIYHPPAMSKNILQALPELIQAGVITAETADQIRGYYRLREGKPANVLFIVFGILGALLVGLGIILMLAHNWDGLPRAARTGLAFLPLVLGQGLGGFVLLRKAQSPTWRESVATLLLLAVGASISLVSQIYHITTGNLSGFLLTWMLLGLPLIYLLRSSTVSLFYLLGITWFAIESKDLFAAASPSWFYWLLLLVVLPHYYRLYRQQPEGNFTVFHHWLLPLSVAFALLITVEKEAEEWLVLAFGSLFSLYCLIGHSGWLAGQKLRNNSYLVLGTLGIVGLLLALSFDSFWVDLAQQHDTLAKVIAAPEFVAAALLSLLALMVLAGRYRRQPLAAIRPMEISFLFFILAFFVAFLRPSVAMVMTNLVVLFMGLGTIRQGARLGHLSQLNYGLLLITALITCRFFDTDLSFVLRGMLFVLVGLGFFGANYWMLQTRKTHEK